MSNLVILHHGGGCPDGFTAAWAAWKKHPDAKFIPVKHKDPYPEGLEDKDVIIVDFCYPREELLKLKGITKSLKVLDHHISAMEDCGDLDFCYFDMTRSGAGISWDYFHPKTIRPWLISYIEYRDLGFLWTKPKEEHPDRLDEVLTAIDSYSKSFEQWDQFFTSESHGDDRFSLDSLAKQGAAILRYKERLVETILHHKHEIEIDGKKALCANTPFLQSEVGNALAKECGLGVTWYKGSDGVKFSLRSVPEKFIDCAKIATKFPGGGGHKMASGFSRNNISVERILDNNQKDELSNAVIEACEYHKKELPEALKEKLDFWFEQYKDIK